MNFVLRATGGVIDKSKFIWCFQFYVFSRTNIELGLPGNPSENRKSNLQINCCYFNYMSWNLSKNFSHHFVILLLKIQTTFDYLAYLYVGNRLFLIPHDRNLPKKEVKTHCVIRWNFNIYFNFLFDMIFREINETARKPFWFLTHLFNNNYLL